MQKPLARSEWGECNFAQALDKLDGYVKVDADFMRRTLATIEAGGFAPEPITQHALLSWLWAAAVDVPTNLQIKREFNQDDLGRALAAAARFGANPGIYPAPRKPGWNVGWTDGHYCSDLGVVARTLAAIAYREAKRPDAPDVMHLLGDSKEIT